MEDEEEKNGLSSFLFGNVNEQGELDDDILDAETRQALTNISSSLLDTSNLIGISKADVTETDNSSGPAAKAADAQDFSDINEVVDETMEDGASASIMNMPSIRLGKSSSSTTSSVSPIPPRVTIPSQIDRSLLIEQSMAALDKPISAMYDKPAKSLFDDENFDEEEEAEEDKEALKQKTQQAAVGAFAGPAAMAAAEEEEEDQYEDDEDIAAPEDLEEEEEEYDDGEQSPLSRQFASQSEVKKAEDENQKVKRLAAARPPIVLPQIGMNRTEGPILRYTDLFLPLESITTDIPTHAKHKQDTDVTMSEREEKEKEQRDKGAHATIFGEEDELEVFETPELPAVSAQERKWKVKQEDSAKLPWLMRVVPSQFDSADRTRIDSIYPAGEPLKADMESETAEPVIKEELSSSYAAEYKVSESGSEDVVSIPASLFLPVYQELWEQRITWDRTEEEERRLLEEAAKRQHRLKWIANRGTMPPATHPLLSDDVDEIENDEDEEEQQKDRQQVEDVEMTNAASSTVIMPTATATENTEGGEAGAGSDLNRPVNPNQNHFLGMFMGGTDVVPHTPELLFNQNGQPVSTVGSAQLPNQLVPIAGAAGSMDMNINNMYPNGPLSLPLNPDIVQPMVVDSTYSIHGNVDPTNIVSAASVSVNPYYQFINPSFINHINTIDVNMNMSMYNMNQFVNNVYAPFGYNVTFTYRNERVANGEWAKCIIWDEDHKSDHHPPTSLTLDLNDPNILFQSLDQDDGKIKSRIANMRDQTLLAADNYRNRSGLNRRGKAVNTLKEQRVEAALKGINPLAVGPGNNKIGKKQTAAAAAAGVTTTETGEAVADTNNNGNGTAGLNGAIGAVPDEEGGIGKGPADAFNLSNDQFYATNRMEMQRIRSKKSAFSVLQHSKVAVRLQFAKTRWTSEELRRWHRPDIRNSLFAGAAVITSNTKPAKWKFYPISTSSPSKIRKEDDEVVNAHEHFKKRSDLSCKDGDFALFEYVEEFPLLMSGFGMASRLTRYHKVDDNGNSLMARPDLAHYADPVFLEQEEAPPILGHVPKGQSLHVLENNMMKAPVYPHTPPTTDFILVRAKSKDGKIKTYLREIPAVFTVGQIEPKAEVPAPGSRQAVAFMQNRVKSFIYRQLERTDQKRVHVNEISNAFSDLSEAAIRKRLKEMCEYQRVGDDGGWWTANRLPNEEEIKTYATPEQVCMYESMLAGHQRLKDVGVEKLVSSERAIPSIRQVQSDAKSDKNRELARYIDEELQLTPWNLSSHYMASIKEGKGLMRLDGVGDPSNRGEGFSYIRLPQKTFDKKGEKKAKIKEAQSTSTVTGTDADLRKLSMAGARNKLLEFGIQDTIIANLSRWERIDMVRKLSSKAVAEGEGGNFSKFARGSKLTYRQQKQRYEQEVKRIFEAQSTALGTEDPGISSEEEEIEEDVDFMEAIEADLEKSLLGTDSSAAQKKVPFGRTRADVEDEEEMKELEKLREKAMSMARPVGLGPISKPPTAEKEKPDGIDADGTEKKKKKKKKKEKEKKKKTVLKLKIRQKNADGTVSFREKILRTEEEIAEYYAKQKEKKEKLAKVRGKGVFKGIAGAPNTEDDSLTPLISGATFPDTDMSTWDPATMKRWKRREADKRRRQLKNLEKKKDLMERLQRNDFGAPGLPDSTVGGESIQGEPDATPSKGASSMRCGACNMYGHMRTNKNCPLYTEGGEDLTATPDGLVQVQGTRVKLALNQINRSAEVKVKINVPRDERKRRKGGLGVSEPDYLQPKGSSSKKPRRRRGDPEIELSNLLQKVVDAMRVLPQAKLFLKPVSAKEVADYYTIIHNPMDIATIKVKVAGLKYRSRDELLADVEQMVLNAKIYNGETSLIYEQAKQVQMAAQREIKFHDAVLKELEGELDPNRSRMEMPTPASTAGSMVSPINSLFDDDGRSEMNDEPTPMQLE